MNRMVVAGAWSIFILTVGFSGGYAYRAYQDSSKVTIVPGKPQEAVILFFQNDPDFRKPPIKSITIQREEARHIAAEFNKLRPINNGVVVCPLDNGDRVEFQFHYENGDRWTVRLDIGGCPLVHIPDDGSAWLPETVLEQVYSLVQIKQ